MSKSHLFLVFIALGFLLLLAQSAFVVVQGEQALVLQFGKPVAQYTTPGLKFKTPFVQDVEYFDARALNVNPTPNTANLADEKRVVVDTFGRYRISNMLVFRNTYGDVDNATRQLDNTINSVTRNVLGTATLTDLLSQKRDALMKSILAQVIDATKNNGVDIIDIRIGRVDLPDENSEHVYNNMKSVFDKLVTQYQSEGQSERKKIMADADKQHDIIIADATQQAQKLMGEGDAQATQIYADAYDKDPKFYAFYRSLKAYRNTFSDGTTTMVLTPDDAFLRYFDAGADKSK